MKRKPAEGLGSILAGVLGGVLGDWGHGWWPYCGRSSWAWGEGFRVHVVGLVGWAGGVFSWLLFDLVWGFAGWLVR